MHFIDVDDINLQARVWLDTVANPRIHGTTGETPFSRLPKEHLQQLPGQRFDTSRISYRQVGRDCLVTYQRNRYSVPTDYAQQTVMVKETEDHQVILVNAAGEVIAQHPLLRGHHQWSVDAAHYAGLPDPLPQQGRKPLAFQATPDDDDTFGRWIAPKVEQRSLHSKCWRNTMTDTVLATTILDHLLHASTTVNIRGESYRLREKRQAGVFPDLADLSSNPKKE